MSAQTINGKSTADKLLAELKEEIQRHQSKQPSFRPGLAIVQVGDRSDSNVYIRNKLLAASKIGIDARHVKLGAETSQQSLLAEIDRLNADDSIDGIIVQLPLETSNQIDTEFCLNRIDPSKDVDGLTIVNAGRLSRGEIDHGTVIPCTPRGCFHLVRSTGVDVKGKHVVVVGRSKIVGKPAADLFLWNHSTVTICHSRTIDLAAVCRTADILIVAIGKSEMIKGDWMKPGAVVIDCGINVLPGQGANGKNKIVGDVAFEEAKQVAGHITPVPGGVGPMTVAMLMRNTFDQAVERRNILGVGGGDSSNGQ